MARSFNGSTDKIECGTAVPAPQAITISAWVNFASLAAAYSSVYSKVFTGNAYHQLFVSSAGKIVTYIFGIGDIHVDPGTNTAVTTGTWNHFAITYDSSDGLRAFVNGVGSGTAAANGALATGFSTGRITSIGTDIGTAGRFVNGRIVDVAMWGIRLFPSEVTALASGMRANRIRVGSLLHYVPLSGRVPNYEPDLTPYANNGTLTGTAFYPDPPFIPDANRILVTVPAEREMPTLFVAPSFISGWSRQSNLPVIGGGTF